MSGPVPSATTPFHELGAAAAYGLPAEGQEHCALLQAKNTDGTLIEAEAAALLALDNAYKARPLDKANALLELLRRGADTGATPRS